MADYATHEDLAAVWRPLTEQEVTRADALLDQAERMVRRRLRDLDERVEKGLLDDADVRDVLLDVVRRGMLGDGREGVTQMSETTGPFANSASFANPLGSLYFTRENRLALGLPAEATSGRVGTIRTVVP